MKKIKLLEVYFIVIFSMGIYSCGFCPRYYCNDENLTFYSMDRLQIMRLHIDVYDKNKRFQGGFTYELIENCEGSDTIYLGKENSCYKVYKWIQPRLKRDTFFHFQPNKIYELEALPRGDCASRKFNIYTDDKAHVLTPKEFISKMYKDSFQLE